MIRFDYFLICSPLHGMGRGGIGHKDSVNSGTEIEFNQLLIKGKITTTNFVYALSIVPVSFYFFKHFIGNEVADGFALFYIVANVGS
jgi:hypothetical protein